MENIGEKTPEYGIFRKGNGELKQN